MGENALFVYICTNLASRLANSLAEALLHIILGGCGRACAAKTKMSSFDRKIAALLIKSAWEVGGGLSGLLLTPL